MSGGPRRIAVLGAGIMGCSVALFLARKGCAVTLIDKASAPFGAASRWNEGKIHLGFLYSGDASMGTAKHVLPGGLRFKPLVEGLIGRGIDLPGAQGEDLYLCHQRSIVPPDAMANYFESVAEVVRGHPDARDYLVDVSACPIHRLTESELSRVSGSPDIVAGFRVPERSVSTNWLADGFVDAVSAEPRIDLRMAARVLAVGPEQPDDLEGRWRVETEGGISETFDTVVNALWEGRLAIDATAGLPAAGIWTHRYRLALFLRTSTPVDLPSLVVATGPFGDIKNYNGRDFYLSWYPDGLRVESAALSPPDPPPLDASHAASLCTSILDRLEGIAPEVARLRASVEHVALKGGWVFAAGQGALSDPRATLHRRSDFRVVRRGAYLSIDTGKFSTAPWLAWQLAAAIG